MALNCHTNINYCMIFKVDKISYKYDKFKKDAKWNLDGVSFSIEKKDFIAIVGRTGSGKSTLISHLNGLLKADSGDILYNGKSIYDNDFDLRGLRFRCGVVFQYPDYQLFSETVIDDICFGAIKKGLSTDEAKIKAIDVMKLLSIEYLKDEPPFNLSGGEKRKVALAGVLVMEPEILILDEPEAGLDGESKNELFALLKKLNEEKDITIIFITHDLDDACEYAHKVFLMNEGKLLKVGTPYEIFSDEDLLNESHLIAPTAIEIYKKYGIKDTKSLKYNDVLNALIKNKCDISKLLND